MLGNLGPPKPLLGFAALVPLLLAAACGGDEEPQTVTVVETVVVERIVEKPVEVERVVVITPEPRLARVAYLNLGTEPPTLDPALATDSVSINLVENLFVGLTNFNLVTSEVEPELATSWDVSPDGTVYTFHLRDDVKWSDGSPVTAHDAAYGIIRTLDPDTASTYAYILTAVIKNAAAFNSGDITDRELVGVKAIDDYTLQVTLGHAAGYFPGNSLHVGHVPPAQIGHGSPWG